jgi:hypothetical protein
MKNGSEVTLAGLVAVRITWITATVVCVVSILIGLLSGTNGGDSSEQFPGFAFSDGGDSSQQLPEFALFEPAAALFAAEAQQKAPRTKTAAAREDRSGRTKEGAFGEGHYRSGVPPRSGSHPQGADGRKPVVTSSPKPARAPSPNPPRLPQAPSVNPPKVPQAPSVDPPKLPQAPSLSPPKLPQAPSLSPPKLPQAPSLSPPKLPQAPSLSPPKLPQAPSEIPAPSPPPVSLKVSAPVTVPKVSVGLP